MLVKKDHALVLMQDPAVFRMLLLKFHFKLAFHTAQFLCGVFCISAKILYTTVSFKKCPHNSFSQNCCIRQWASFYIL